MCQKLQQFFHLRYKPNYLERGRKRFLARYNYPFLERYKPNYLERGRKHQNISHKFI
ncbi:protein of unknown function [Streptococcus thermophilus]|nr:protein of unknown function [Streptococcus thermophilus]